MVRDYAFVPLALAEPMYRAAALCAEILRGNDLGGTREKMLTLLVNLFPENSPEDIFELVMAIGRSTDLLRDSQSKPRRFLQEIGRVFREIHDDAHVRYLLRSATEMAKSSITQNSSEESIRCVVTDLRTPREIDVLRELARDSMDSDFPVSVVFIRIDISMENIVLRISRRDGVSEKYIMERMTHSTEQTIPDDSFDYVIDGNNTLDMVIADLDSILGKILK
jgi:hypothetical protein